MQYLLLIYNDEREWAALPDDERSAITGEYMALVKSMGSAYVGGAPLHPTTTATTVRVREGDEIVTDGPFAETKEQLGGYFLVDVDSDEEAREWAAKIPAAQYGSIEVRPVLPVADEARSGG
jgi:hypothetical protein